MRSLIRAELRKQRTTRTLPGMAAALLGLVLLAVALHALGLPAQRLSDESTQRTVLMTVGVGMGALFAALVGAMTVTTEVRHGTIRPTFLATPRRGRVIAAKSVVVAAVGLGLGGLATLTAIGSLQVLLVARDISVQPAADDWTHYIIGGTAAAALWAVIGSGVGAVVRSQVPAVAGIAVWMLFVENLLIGNVPRIGRFTPVALGQTMAGQTSGTFRTPALGVTLLAVYAGAAFLIGRLVTIRRDVT